MTFSLEFLHDGLDPHKADSGSRSSSRSHSHSVDSLSEVVGVLLNLMERVCCSSVGSFP
jgi:hypothetical protein